MSWLRQVLPGRLRRSEPSTKSAQREAVHPDVSSTPDPKLRILDDGWGHQRSRRERIPVDPAGNPLPWFTYPAIEYLGQLDGRSKRVFEWGCGGSTAFFSTWAHEVVSVERDESWLQRVEAQGLANVTLLHVDTDPEYSECIARFGRFDLIVIDGSRRRECAASAVSALNPGGMIVLDNSDWYVLAAAALRDTGLVQVDLSGFGPVNDYTWTTSVYFRGESGFAPAGDRQPRHGIGALTNFAAEEAEEGS